MFQEQTICPKKFYRRGQITRVISPTLFFCLVSLTLSYAGPLGSRTFPGIKVIGTVTDSSTKFPIPNTTVSALDDKGVLLVQSKTNSQGYYQLSTLKRPKTVSIRVEANGYISQTKGGPLSPFITYTIDFSLTPNHPPSIAPIRARTIRENQRLQFSVIAIDPDKDPLTYSAAHLPQGATFDSKTRIFSWMPTREQAGTYSIEFEVSDGKIIVSRTITIIVKGIDITPPAGTIKINNDSPYIESTQITLNLSAEDNLGGSGLHQMSFSNDNQSWSNPESYGATKTWDLASSDGSKTVYVKFSDKRGNWSSVYSDTIILDTLPPITTFSKDEGPNWRNTSVTFTLTAVDSGTGIDKTYYSIDGSNPAIGYIGPVTLAEEGVYNVKYYSVDKFGRRESIKSAFKYDYIIIDKTSPKGSIKINNDSQYSNSESVVLDLSAGDPLTGVKQMRFSNDNAKWSNPKDYDTQRNWSLTPGDGTKTVYVRFEDGVGNWSGPFSDTIILDTTPPKITGLNPADNSALYENEEVIISPQADDNNLGLLEYQFSIDGAVKQPWSKSNNYSWVPTFGRHNIKIEVKDINGQDTKEKSIYIFRKPIEPL